MQEPFDIWLFTPHQHWVFMMLWHAITSFSSSSRKTIWSSNILTNQFQNTKLRIYFMWLLLGSSTRSGRISTGNRILPRWSKFNSWLPMDVCAGNRILPRWSKFNSWLPMDVCAGNRILPRWSKFNSWLLWMCVQVEGKVRTHSCASDDITSAGKQTTPRT